MDLRILSIAKYSWDITAKAFAKESKKSIRKQQYKILFGTLFNFKCVNQWFSILETPKFKLITKFRPRLYMKPFRVYMSTKWGKLQKIKVIQDTYKFIHASSSALSKVVEGNESLEILRFKLNENKYGLVTLGYDEGYRKEGELVLSFSCDLYEGAIASLAFSFEECKENQWICRIGCVQGHSTNEDNLTKTLQKEMYGLRPKNLVLFVMQEMASNLGLSGIYGAADIIQAYRRKHFFHLHWRHAIQFDYDEFWSEAGGNFQKLDGWYQLPLTMNRKDIQDIKSSKRSMYNKRYKMLDDFSLQIKQSLFGTCTDSQLSELFLGKQNGDN